MIPYEQLCEALERYSRRRDEQQELEPLEQVEEVPQEPQDGLEEQLAVAADEPSASRRETAPQFAVEGAELADPTEDMALEPEAGDEDPTTLEQPLDPGTIEPGVTEEPIELATQELDLDDADSVQDAEPEEEPLQ